MKSFHFCKAKGYQSLRETQSSQVQASSLPLALLILLVLPVQEGNLEGIYPLEPSPGFQSTSSIRIS